jgi:hypothetical protein
MNGRRGFERFHPLYKYPLPCVSTAWRGARTGTTGALREAAIVPATPLWET